MLIDSYNLKHSFCRPDTNLLLPNDDSPENERCLCLGTATLAKRVSVPFKSDAHSKVAPPLPIPNRTVKRLSANDSAATRVKVGQRQTPPLCLF
jgi:hypothetical protein